MQQQGLISMDTMLFSANAMQEVMKVIKETRTVIGQVWKEQRNREVEKNMKKIEAEKMSKKNTKSVSPSRKSKSSSRVRPNSNLPGSNVNVCRSPSRGSPLSPSRPIVALSRGRRLVNVAVNMQKSLNLEASNSSSAANKKFNEETPVKQKSHRSSPRKSTPTTSSSSLDLRLSDSTEAGSSDSYHSSKEHELSTFLNNFPTTDPPVSSTPSDCNSKASNHISAIFPHLGLEPGQSKSTSQLTSTINLTDKIRVLTEEPESESAEELFSTPRLLPAYKWPRVEKDYKKLQETEYERVRAEAREKDYKKLQETEYERVRA